MRRQFDKTGQFPHDLRRLRDTGGEYLAVPQWMGQIMKNPRNNLAALKSNVKRYSWAYPGLSLQCLALYNPDKYGLYAACNDTMAYIKNFSFSLDTLNTLVYRMHNLPSVDSLCNSYEPPYSAVIGTFKGNWITAAEIYRDWGSQQWWTRESRFKNHVTPDWLESTALWVWNRSKSGNVLIPARDMKNRLGLPVSVFWHWWHGCSYDDEFPKYVPPREGKESFISAVSAANKEGIRAIVYMNQRLWGTTTESWTKENAAVYALKNPDGKINTHVYNIFSNRPTASMCLGTQFWKDKYASLCDSAVNTYTANGVYMEQARSFVWGMQPTIANYQAFLARDRKDEVDFLLNLARVRNQAVKYLLYGKFMRSPEIELPEEEFGISRLSIYAGKTGNSVTAFRGTFPIIYSGTWQADDKDLGIALASISDYPVEVSFKFSSDDYELPPSGKIFIIDKTGKRELTSYSNKEVKVDLALNPRDICVLEITTNMISTFGV